MHFANAVCENVVGIRVWFAWLQVIKFFTAKFHYLSLSVPLALPHTASPARRRARAHKPAEQSSCVVSNRHGLDCPHFDGVIWQIEMISSPKDFEESISALSMRHQTSNRAEKCSRNWITPEFQPNVLYLEHELSKMINLSVYNKHNLFQWQKKLGSPSLTRQVIWLWHLLCCARLDHKFTYQTDG